MEWHACSRILWLALCLLAVQEGKSQSRIFEYAFTQRLDHFDGNNAGYFKQRYWVSDRFVNGDTSSPIFLHVGGEYNMTKSWMESAAWVDYAKYFRAMCFQIEHRYYGESRPTIQYRTPAEYYRYLSTDQALADIRNFILAMKTQYRLGNRKWVLFGGSYSATIAAWARSAYPDLVHIAISSSGPVEAIADFKGYNNVVWSALNQQSPRCGDLLHEISIDYHRNGQRSEVSKLSGQVSGQVQYGNAQSVCQMVNKLAGRAADLDEVINETLNTTKFEHGIRFLGLPPVDDEEESRTSYINVADTSNTWMWQTCTEFGWWVTSSTNSELFGTLNNVQSLLNSYCSRFGINLQTVLSRIQQTNVKWKGLRGVYDRVFFTQGQVDPWRAAGFTSSSNPRMPVIDIQGASHCADYYAFNQNKRIVYQVQMKILQQIGLWLREP